MTAVKNATETYVLGNYVHEQERLKMQATFLKKWTEIQCRFEHLPRLVQTRLEVTECFHT